MEALHNWRTKTDARKKTEQNKKRKHNKMNDDSSFLSLSLYQPISTLYSIVEVRAIDFYAISEYLQRKIGQITYVRSLYVVILYFILLLLLCTDVFIEIETGFSAY